MLNSAEHESLTVHTTKILINKTVLAFKLSDDVFIMLINIKMPLIYHAHTVKMPTIVGILTFMSMIIFMFS